MGVKAKRVVGRAHSMIERGEKIPIQKLHYIMRKHLINPITKYLGIQVTGNYTHVNTVQEEKSHKPICQKSLKVNKQRTLEQEYSLISVH